MSGRAVSCLHHLTAFAGRLLTELMHSGCMLLYQQHSFGAQTGCLQLALCPLADHQVLQLLQHSLLFCCSPFSA